MSTQQKGGGKQPAGDLPEQRNPADEEFELRAWITSGVLSQPIHVVEGAASLAGWTADTALTRRALTEGIRAFENYVPEREE